MVDELMGDMTAARPPGVGELERERPYFAPGVEAQYPFAVLYQGEFETLHDGTAIAVRRHARALSDTGIPVKLLSFSNTVLNEHGVREPAHMGLHELVDREVGVLRETTASALAPLIKHVVVTSAAHLRNLLTPRGAVALSGDAMDTVRLRREICRRTILYTVWERAGIDEELAREMARCGQLWVPCEQNRQMLVDSGVPAEKVYVVPHPYDPNDDVEKLLRRRPNTEWRLFYSIGRWEPRKAYAELIEAFLREFSPSEKVLLTIKYSGGGHWENYPTPDEAVQKALALPEIAAKWNAETAAERVRLVSKHLTRSGIVELHFRNNVYVACSHGEAHNFGAFEAKQAGNRMVYALFGSMRDYSASDDVDMGEPGLEPVPVSYRWGTASWGVVSVAALRAALRRALPPEKLEQPPRLRLYRADFVGARMKDLVLQLLDAEGASEPAKYYRTEGKIG